MVRKNKIIQRQLKYVDKIYGPTQPLQLAMCFYSHYPAMQVWNNCNVNPGPVNTKLYNTK